MSEVLDTEVRPVLDRADHENAAAKTNVSVASVGLTADPDHLDHRGVQGDGVTTYCTDRRDPDYGFTRVELHHEFHGIWSCDCRARTWDGQWFGPVCTVCGEWGTPPGVRRTELSEDAPTQRRIRRPKPRPAGQVVTRRQVVARLVGLRRHLRESPVAERDTRLHWVASKIAEMLVLGDLPDVRAAAHTLRDDAVAIGFDREGAQEIIGTALVEYGVVTAA